ncbi:MAG: hypothetical protein QG585_543 [Patescibacteria group bacterium]|jgi:hypothetical protein|nr:hypothetical protein [Patescibacteria group bacterium]
METLEKIFGSQHKAKVMKLFLFNPLATFDLETVVKRVKGRAPNIRKELNSLEKIKLVKKKETRNIKGRKVAGFVLNQSFSHIGPLQDFLLKVSPFTNLELVRKLGGAGRLKLVVISGVFLNDSDARVDILVVGDKVKKNVLEKILVEVEADLGREIKYAVMDSGDFEYRLSIGDKLVRDIFDYRHEIIFNKIGLVD